MMKVKVIRYIPSSGMLLCECNGKRIAFTQVKTEYVESYCDFVNAQSIVKLIE